MILLYTLYSEKDRRLYVAARAIASKFGTIFDFKQIIKKHGYVKRKAQKVIGIGTCKYRNKQFEIIARLRAEYQAAGNSIIRARAKITLHFKRRCIPSGYVPKARNILIFLRFHALPARHLNT